MAYNYFGVRVRDPIQEHRRRVRYGLQLRFALRDKYDPLDLSVEAFTEMYRMPQDVFMRLYQLLLPLAEQRLSHKLIPFHLRLLCALYYYATGSYQEHSGSSHFHTMSQSSVCKSIEEVTNLLNHPLILPNLIRFPMTHEERAASIEINSRLGLPGVLGMVDGTLVEIFPPVKPNQHYYCRKRFTALNAMIVCDANLRILHVDARYPGSAHDAYVYRWGPLRTAMQRAYQEDRCWLLGDSGYPLEPWLMPPIPDAPRGTPEFNYTKLHSQCRNSVERCIGVLKARWRCLFINSMHYSPQKAGKLFNACAALNNFLKDNGVPVPVNHPIFQDVPNADADNLDAEVVGVQAAGQVQEAAANRAHLVEHVDWFINRNNAL